MASFTLKGDLDREINRLNSLSEPEKNVLRFVLGMNRTYLFADLPLASEVTPGFQVFCSDADNEQDTSGGNILFSDGATWQRVDNTDTATST